MFISLVSGVLVEPKMGNAVLVIKDLAIGEHGWVGRALPVRRPAILDQLVALFDALLLKKDHNSPARRRS